MSQVTVISGVERRRAWTKEQKRALVAAASAPGSSVTEVARQADLRPSQIYRWRRDLDLQDEPGFVSVTLESEPDRGATEHDGIVVELGGTVVRIGAGVSPVLAAAVMRSPRR